MAMHPASPAILPPGVWRADQLGHGGVATLASTFAELDAQLPGGGWPLGMLTELIAREPGIGEMRLIVPVLQRLSRERRTVLLLGPPHIPYAPALAAFGIDLEHLIVVRAEQPADRLWAVEQALRSASFGALLAWLPRQGTRTEHLRRMQLAAQATRAPLFLFRHLPARFEASPSPLRLLLSPLRGQRLTVELLKRRGPALAQPLTLELPGPPSVLRPGRATGTRDTGGGADAGVGSTGRPARRPIVAGAVPPRPPAATLDEDAVAGGPAPGTRPAAVLRLDAAHPSLPGLSPTPRTRH
jgi:protein ImuA